MNEQNKNPQPTEENWLDDILEPAPQSQEIGPDEQAVASAGLSHPDDAELDRLLQEMKDFSWATDDSEVSLASETDLSNPMTDDTVFLDLPQEYTAPSEIADEPTMQIPVIPQEYSDIPEELPPEEEEPEEAPLPKRRPKMKKGYGFFGIPHILATGVWLAIILVIGVTLGRIVWLCAADVLAFTQTPKDHEIVISISEEDTLDDIAQQLKEAELIRYPELFKMFAEITGKDQRISAGTFNLGSHLDYNAMINSMGSYGAARVEVEVLFPEGINCAQAFRILEKNGVCTVAELEEYAANGELDDYWFLEGVERGHKYCLEGYLAPDTYKFYTNYSPKRVFKKFLDEFDDRFTDIMKEDLAEMQNRYAKMLAKNGYSNQYIEEHPLTLHQVLTIASIVDRETASDSESYDIASIFYNRLTNPDYPTLGSDATVYYAIGDYFREKDALTEADLNFDSPYNTRKSEGLPPGPICNPSVYSLYAALDPNDTKYYFFIYDRENYYHHFSKNLKEHEKKAAELGY